MCVAKLININFKLLIKIKAPFIGGAHGLLNLKFIY